MKKTISVAAIALMMGCTHTSNPVDTGTFPIAAGPILLTSDETGTYQLYSMYEDGSNVQQLTSDPNFPIIDAKWSPDGKRIAVVSLLGDDMTYGEFRRAIFIMDADGKNRCQLTQQWFTTSDSARGTVEYGGAFSPVWSPDSRQIAYSRLMVPETYANREIFIINADGTSERRVTGSIGMGETVTDWSVDGALLLSTAIDWSKQNSKPTVDILSIHGELNKHITPDTLTSGGGLWSPDQQHIVFTSWGSVRHEVYLANGSGNNVHLLPTTNYTFNDAAAWSSTSERIVVNSSGHIFVVELDGSELTDLTPKSLLNSTAVSWKRM